MVADLSNVRAVRAELKKVQENEEYGKEVVQNEEDMNNLFNLIEDVDGNPSIRYAAMELAFALQDVSDGVVVDQVMSRGGLTRWIYVDIQDWENKETAALAMKMLVLVINQMSVPEQVRDVLGFALADQLIGTVLHFDDAEAKNDRWGAQIFQWALRALLCMNLHMSNSSTAENRVLNKLLRSEHDVQRVGAIFITVLIRQADDIAIPALAKLMHDLFENDEASKSFFYTNDLKVLVEVLIDALRDMHNESYRQLYFDILADVVLKSDYASILHRKDALVELLTTLASSESDPLSQKASTLLEQASFLRV